MAGKKCTAKENMKMKRQMFLTVGELIFLTEHRKHKLVTMKSQAEKQIKFFLKNYESFRDRNTFIISTDLEHCTGYKPCNKGEFVKDC